MYDKNKVLNEVAVKRLNAIKEFTELGSGFAIGIEMFLDMLNNEIKVLKGEKINGQLLFIGASRITRMFRFLLKEKKLVITLDTVKLDKHFIYYLIELMEVINKAISGA